MLNQLFRVVFFYSVLSKKRGNEKNNCLSFSFPYPPGARNYSVLIGMLVFGLLASGNFGIFTVNIPCLKTAFALLPPHPAVRNESKNSYLVKSRFSCSTFFQSALLWHVTGSSLETT